MIGFGRHKAMQSRMAGIIIDAYFFFGAFFFLLCFQGRNTSSVYKIALEKYEYSYYKTKQTLVTRHYVHHAKATVWSPGYEN